MRTTTIALLSAGLMGCMAVAPTRSDGRAMRAAAPLSVAARPSPLPSSSAARPVVNASTRPPLSEPDASPQTADASAPLAITGPTGQFAPANAERFRALITDGVAHSPEVGTEKFHVVFVAGGARQLALDAGNLTIIPIRVTIDGYTGGYCWLGVYLGDEPHPGLIRTVEYDECSGMRRVVEADLNHDGMPDLVFQLSVRSRRYHVDVPEAAVYLSDRRSGTYCYAPDASGPITSLAAYTADGAVRAVENQVHRLGESVLRCAPP